MPTTWRALGLMGAVTAGVVAGCDDGAPTEPVERTPLEYGGGEFTQLIMSAGVERAYLVVVPPEATPGEAAPVLFVFHGTPQSVRGIRRMSDMDRVAGERGWIVVYPQALFGRWASVPTFFPATAGQDDDIFVRDMLDFLGEDLNIDRERVYAIGFSNGATMIQAVACELDDVVTAVSSVGATLPTERTRFCPTPDRPVPMVLFLGDLDGQFAWEGLGGPRGIAYSGPGTAEFFALRNGCEPEGTLTRLPDEAPDDGTTVDLLEFACPPGAETHFYRIRQGGHTWPGSPVTLDPIQFGHTNRDISASEISVEFFSRHRIGG